MDIPKFHRHLPKRTATALAETVPQEEPRFSTAIGKNGFDCTPKNVKEYFLELATYQSIQEASFFPNNIDPSSIFEMSSFNWDESNEQEVMTQPSLYTILNQSACEEDRMNMLRDVLRNVTRDPEYESLRGEVRRLFDLQAAEETLPINDLESLDEKAVRLAQHLHLKDLKRLPQRQKKRTGWKDGEGQSQEKKESATLEKINGQVPVIKEFSIDFCKLMYGMAGNTRMAVLYFPYNCSFDTFLVALRSETYLQTGKGVGYTLEDGPWSYKMERNGKLEGDWYDITDEASFLVMVDKLKSADGRAMVFHSIELSKQDEYEQQNNADMKNQAEVVNGILDEDGEPFFDGCYSAFLKKSV